MDINQNSTQNSQNEFYLRDIILALWRQKIVILSITLIAAILTGLFSVFVLSPVYQANLNIVISIPKVCTTRFGEYELPINTNEQYIKLITSNNVLTNTINDMGYASEGTTLEDLKAKITINTVDSAEITEQNSFDVIVSADNPDEALKLSEILYDNYIEFLNVMTKERAVTYYYDKFSIDIKSLKILLESNQEILKKNEQLLSETPQTIDQKEAMQELQDQINISDFVVLENIINPNYTKIENDIIINKQLIFTEEDSIRMYTNYLEELDIEKKAIEIYYEKDNKEKLESSLISIIDNSVYLPSPPVKPTHKVGPNNKVNVIIGTFLGGMLGVLVTLIKKYWFDKD
jgi:capsular polysaccharide biosynthesis protein